MQWAESVLAQERERNKAELAAAIARHSQKAASAEEELLTLQQVRYMHISSLPCCPLGYFPILLCLFALAMMRYSVTNPDSSISTSLC